MPSTGSDDDLLAFRHPRADVLDRYWAGRFGLPDDWAERASVFVVHITDQGRDRFVLYRRARATVVRCHPDLVEPLGLLNDGCDDVEALRNRGESLGTESLLYLDPSELVTPPTDGTLVRRLTSEDAAAFEAFVEACSIENVSRANVRLVHPGLYGVRVDDRLVAAASLIHHGPDVTDVGILVHPDHRRRGHGRRAVAAAATCDEVGPRIVQYCTRDTNHGSRRIATTLGFRLYAIEEWYRTTAAG